MFSVIYCPRCYQVLKNLGVSECEFFEEVCKGHFATSGFVLDDIPPSVWDISETLFRKALLERLERKGYVLSTEIDKDRILVKPLGIKTNKYFTKICFE